MRIALAQVNPTVGDIEGNAALLREWTGRAHAAGADLVLFPELVLTGYLPEDLLLRRDFQEAAEDALHALAAGIEGIAALVGFPERAGEHLYNSVAVLQDGSVGAIYRKTRLPNYGVFDEKRYFEPGRDAETIEVAGSVAGLTVCEDLWLPGGPAAAEAEAGARVILNASASPYHQGKGAERELMFAERASETGAAIALCNLVGGQDELVFDGHSIVVSAEGEVIARAPQWEEALLVCELPRGGEVAPLLSPEAEVYGALVTGTRDYVEKNGFSEVVFGISGGIDSALVAMVAADALGPGRVNSVSMPSRYSSEGTRSDAQVTAENLGIGFRELPIGTAMDSYDSLLEKTFEGTEPGIAEENLQARIRGNIVMALSNKFGWLVLTTGNKSEMSVGYATLYGDMAGGFAVLKDVYKGWVYRLVRWRNEQAGRDLVPASTLDRPPSAELRYEQRDQDSLPAYDVLDPILEGYIEESRSPAELAAQGFPRDDVEHVVRLVDLAEYKRRQAPPGIRISTKAFGRDRRLPITNRWSG